MSTIHCDLYFPHQLIKVHSKIFLSFFRSHCDIEGNKAILQNANATSRVLKEKQCYRSQHWPGAFQN